MPHLFVVADGVDDDDDDDEGGGDVPAYDNAAGAAANDDSADADDVLSNATNDDDVNATIVGAAAKIVFFNYLLCTLIFGCFISMIFLKIASSIPFQNLKYQACRKGSIP